MRRVSLLVPLASALLVVVSLHSAVAGEFEQPLGIYARWPCYDKTDPAQFEQAMDAYAGTARFVVEWNDFQHFSSSQFDTTKAVWHRILAAGEAGFSVELDIYTRCLEWATEHPPEGCPDPCDPPAQPPIPSFPPDSVVTSFGDQGWYPEYYNFVRKLIARIEAEGVTIRWVVIEGEASRHSEPRVCGEQWAGTFDEYAKLLQTGYKAVHDTTLTGARVADSGLGSEWWGLMPAYMLYRRDELPSSFVAQDSDLVAWTNSYFLADTVECNSVSPDAQGWDGEEELESTVTSGVVAAACNKAWDYLVAIRDLADSTGEPIMGALSLHLYDGYDCYRTASDDSCTSCIDDIRIVTDAFLADVFPTGLPLISNEMGRNKLSVSGRGWQDEGDPMAWQTLKMLVRGMADSLEYINWYQLEEPFDVERCRWAFFDLVPGLPDSTSECPVALDPEWPDLPGVYQSHNPRWAYHAYRTVAKLVNQNPFEPDFREPSWWTYGKTERLNYVDRFVFYPEEAGVENLHSVYVMWLHERAPVDISQEVSIAYPNNYVIGYTISDYKDAEVQTVFGQSPLITACTLVEGPIIQRWLWPDSIRFRDPPGHSSAWTLEKGTSLEFKTIALVEGDTLDLTPWATVEKVSEDPNFEPPSTSLSNHILTVTFGNHDTCSVILRMTWNGVTQDSAFMQITRDDCTLQGTQDSVRIAPGGPVGCLAPWVSFPAQATCYSHFAGQVYSCNVTAAATTAWSSTNSGVASVDSLGRVSPVGEGSCSIVVTTGAGSLRDTLDVTVSQ